MLRMLAFVPPIRHCGSAGQAGSHACCTNHVKLAAMCDALVLVPPDAESEQPSTGTIKKRWPAVQGRDAVSKEDIIRAIQLVILPRSSLQDQQQDQEPPPNQPPPPPPPPQNEDQQDEQEKEEEDDQEEEPPEEDEEVYAPASPAVIQCGFDRAGRSAHVRSKYCLHCPSSHLASSTGLNA